MKQITFFLDFISPYAYLAFKALPQALEGLSYGVRYQPVFLGGLLKAKQQLGPAEIPMKREWVYRQSQWLAQAQGVRLDLPAAHPFNPLGLLRLAVASDPQGNPNRYVCEILFRHVWEGGLDAADVQRLQALTTELAPARDPNSDEVRDQLKAHTNDVSVQQSHLEIGSEVLQDCVHKFDCGHNAQYLRQAKILDPANPSQIFA